MEIDVKDYLDKKEMKYLASKAFMLSCQKHFEEENNIKRIISNSAYDIVYKMVDESLNEDLKDIVTEKVKDIIADFSLYNVFKKPDAWDNEPNGAYKHLQKCIESHYPEIKTTVKKLVEGNVESETLLYLKEDIAKIVQESVLELFKKS
ncbi:MAG: hypothetical protein GY679_01080 [Mycoplasma sp.]|nr:hypothetical protein [Mycoplasma sp.]